MADGDGPVNTLDAALRAALVRYYHQLQDVQLTTTKVRIIDSRSGTRLTRVIIQSSDAPVPVGHRRRPRQHRRGSLRALVDSLSDAPS